MWRYVIFSIYSNVSKKSISVSNVGSLKAKWIGNHNVILKYGCFYVCAPVGSNVLSEVRTTKERNCNSAILVEYLIIFKVKEKQMSSIWQARNRYFNIYSAFNLSMSFYLLIIPTWLVNNMQVHIYFLFCVRNIRTLNKWMNIIQSKHKNIFQKNISGIYIWINKLFYVYIPAK